MSFAKKLAESGHLTKAQVARVEASAAAFTKAAAADPKFLEEALQKLGFFDRVSEYGGRALRSLGGAALTALPVALGTAAATATVAGGAGALSEAYKSIRDSLGKAKAYKTMMDEAGDRIRGIPSKQVQQSFNTLYRVNPEYARDPVIAAEFIRETNRSEAFPFQLLKTLQPEGRKGGDWMDYQKLVPQTDQAKALQAGQEIFGK